MKNVAMSEIDTTGSLGILMTAARLLQPVGSESGALRALIDFLLSPIAALDEATVGLTSEVRGVLADAVPDGAPIPGEANQAATRALLIFAEAVALFGSQSAAYAWWTTPVSWKDCAAFCPRARACGMRRMRRTWLPGFGALLMGSTKGGSARASSHG